MTNSPDWYKPPAADVSSAVDAGAPVMAPELAGIMARVGARTFDWLAGLGLASLAGTIHDMVRPDPPRALDLVALQAQAGQYILEVMAGVAATVIGSLLHHVLAEALCGATFGKALGNLRVLREDMAPCNVKGAIIRNLTYYIDALFCGLVAFATMSRSPRRQRLGDQWGKTIVVNAAKLDRVPPSKLAVPLGVGVALLVSLLVGVAGRFLPLPTPRFF